MTQRTPRESSWRRFGRYSGRRTPLSDTSQKSSATINRRSLLLGAIFMLGGAAALTRFARKSAANDLEAGALLGAVRAARAGRRRDHSAHRYTGRAGCRRAGLHSPDAGGVGYPGDARRYCRCSRKRRPARLEQVRRRVSRAARRTAPRGDARRGRGRRWRAKTWPTANSNRWCWWATTTRKSAPRRSCATSWCPAPGGRACR